MLFPMFRKKELKTVWQVSREGRESLLIGTAHFFPYSFRNSVARLLKSVRVVLFEGPLDDGSMERVRMAGTTEGSTQSLLDDLDRATLSKMAKALAVPLRSSTSLQWIASVREESVHEMTRGMKPWMAFFSVYYRFLRQNGWKSSVDMEAFRVAADMGKEIVFLETIEEQIQVLEGLSRPMIIDFLKRIDHWKHYTRLYTKWYLDGDLDAIASNRFGFPTRDPWVIDRRDKILYERMLPYLEAGDVTAFVGVPHVVGISAMMRADGFVVKKCKPGNK